MIGLDTNILARYYIEDASDVGSLRQREIARGIIESGQSLMICKTVLLELEWVMRGYYHFRPEQIIAVLGHLLSLPQVTIEDRESVEQALQHYHKGFDFADILHHASYQACEMVMTFDDKRFSRRAKRSKLLPPVIVPT